MDRTGFTWSRRYRGRKGIGRWGRRQGLERFKDELVRVQELGIVWTRCMAVGAFPVGLYGRRWGGSLRWCMFWRIWTMVV